MTARKPAKSESLLDMLATVDHRGAARICAGCASPANVEVLEVLAKAADGTLLDKRGRPSCPSIPVLYSLFRARAEALGVPYPNVLNAFKRHVTECHREEWRAAQARR